MFQQLKDQAARHLPFLGIYKRFTKAALDTFTPKHSYSQYREDVFVESFLKDYNLDGGIYVDVGANHPTDISNTYLLYKKGHSGVIVEPNTELTSLFARFRKRDICLSVGCGKSTRIAKFNISKTPVLSSFEKVEKVWKTLYVPILPLDIILESIPVEYIFFLSIDVEGLNYEVLQSAISSLKKTLLLCIEFDSEEESDEIKRFLSLHSFKILNQFSCNLIFLNEALDPVKRTAKTT